MVFFVLLLSHEIQTRTNFVRSITKQKLKEPKIKSQFGMWQCKGTVDGLSAHWDLGFEFSIVNWKFQTKKEKRLQNLLKRWPANSSQAHQIVLVDKSMFWLIFIIICLSLSLSRIYYVSHALIEHWTLNDVMVVAFIQ